MMQALGALIALVIIGLFGGLFATGGEMGLNLGDYSGGVTWAAPDNPTD